MIKETDIIIAIVFFVLLFVFLVIVFFLMRRLLIGGFQKKCRALGLQPSPLDSYFCLGNWRDARVVIERSGERYGHRIYVFMDLGELPPNAARNIGYFMQGMTADYFTVKVFEPNSELGRIVGGTWRGLYLYSENLRTHSTVFDMKQLCDALYQIRNELRRRIFQR